MIYHTIRIFVVVGDVIVGSRHFTTFGYTWIRLSVYMFTVTTWFGRGAFRRWPTQQLRLRHGNPKAVGLYTVLSSPIGFPLLHSHVFLS